MKTINSAHVFAGKGGGIQADIRLGHKPVMAVEYIADRQATLRTNVPGMELHGDICDFDGRRIKGVDLLCGGSPCKNFSAIGDNRGLDGAQSGLWFEMKRVIAEAEPHLVQFENVENLLRGHAADWKTILKDFTKLGYGGTYCVMSAAHVGLPHRRNRVWLLAQRGLQGFRQVQLPDWESHYGALANLDARSVATALNAPVTAQAPKLWPTPRVGGRGTRKFVRKVSTESWASFDIEGGTRFVNKDGLTYTALDGKVPEDRLPKGLKLRDDLETTLFMNASKAGALQDAHVMDAAWVTQLMGWEASWLGYPVIELNPLERATPAEGLLHCDDTQKNNQDLEALGDGQVPACASAAFLILNAANKQ